MEVLDDKQKVIFSFLFAVLVTISFAIIYSFDQTKSIRKMLPFIQSQLQAHTLLIITSILVFIIGVPVITMLFIAHENSVNKVY